MDTNQIAAAVQDGQANVLELWAAVRRFAQRSGLCWYRAMDGRAGMVLEDYMQVAFLALLDALEGWNPEAGVFLTWYGLRLKAAFSEATGQRTQRERRDPLQGYVSLDMPIAESEDDALTLGDVLPDPAAEMDFAYIEERDFFRRRKEVLNSVLENLPQEQSRVLKIRYYANLSVSQAAKQLNMDSAEVRRTEHKGLLQLRKPNVRRKLIEYL